MDQLEQACRLLYRKYQMRGYCEENQDRLHYSPYMFGEHSRTFVLEDSQRVSGTVSVFPDSKRGIPLESLYPEEIRRLREEGARFAEMGLLATEMIAWSIDSNCLSSKEKMFPVFLLFKIGVNYTVSIDIDHLLIVVHPRHQKIYELFGFKQFAEERSYEAVCGKPAVPMIKKLTEEPQVAVRSLKKFFFASPFASKHLSRRFADAPDPFSELFGDAYKAYDSVAGAARSAP